MMKKSASKQVRPDKSALTKAVEAILDRAGSLLDALTPRPQPVLVPVRVEARRRRAG